jgi:YggT family protein
MLLNTVVGQITDPILNPIRRILPSTGMLDFSPLVAIIVLQVIEIVVLNIF